MEPKILSEEQIEDIADRSAGKAVKTMLITLGIDTDHPLEVQADMKFSHRMRTMCESAGTKIVMVIIGVVVLGICALIGKSIWPG